MRRGSPGRVTRLRARPERGASAVEYAVLTPVFLVLCFLVIQAGMYYYARNIAQSAAEDAARSARATQATRVDIDNPLGQSMPSDGELQTRARAGYDATINALDPDHSFFREGNVEAHGDVLTGQVRIDVRGHSVNLLPHVFPTANIHARAGGPVEIFKAPGAN